MMTTADFKKRIAQNTNHFGKKSVSVAFFVDLSHNTVIKPHKISNNLYTLLVLFVFLYMSVCLTVHVSHSGKS